MHVRLPHSESLFIHIETILPVHLPSPTTDGPHVPTSCPIRWHHLEAHQLTSLSRQVHPGEKKKMKKKKPGAAVRGIEVSAAAAAARTSGHHASRRRLPLRPPRLAPSRPTSEHRLRDAPAPPPQVVAPSPWTSAGPGPPVALAPRLAARPRTTPAHLRPWRSRRIAIAC